MRMVYTFGNDNLQANNCIVPFILVAAQLITVNMFTTATTAHQQQAAVATTTTNAKQNKHKY